MKKKLMIVTCVLLVALTTMACNLSDLVAAVMAPASTESTKVTAEAGETNSTVVKAIDVVDDTYFEELSCVDLKSCTTKIVPEGVTTIGYKRTGLNSCDPVIFHQGETIDYSKVNEFHSYPTRLPALTNEEDFAMSQVTWIDSCNPPK